VSSEEAGGGRDAGKTSGRQQQTVTVTVTAAAYSVGQGLDPLPAAFKELDFITDIKYRPLLWD
jgi:hypothetical protein